MGCMREDHSDHIIVRDGFTGSEMLRKNLKNWLKLNVLTVTVGTKAKNE